MLRLCIQEERQEEIKAASAQLATFFKSVFLFYFILFFSSFISFVKQRQPECENKAVNDVNIECVCCLFFNFIVKRGFGAKCQIEFIFMFFFVVVQQNIMFFRCSVLFYIGKWSTRGWNNL